MQCFLYDTRFLSVFNSCFSRRIHNWVGCTTFRKTVRKGIMQFYQFLFFAFLTVNHQRNVVPGYFWPQIVYHDIILDDLLMLRNIQSNNDVHIDRTRSYVFYLQSIVLLSVHHIQNECRDHVKSLAVSDLLIPARVRQQYSFEYCPVFFIVLSIETAASCSMEILKHRNTTLL